MKGIYKITNLINNKKYYGSSVNIRARWNRHASQLTNNIHHNQHLQSSWNRNGENVFEFKVVLLCEEFELEYYEQWYLDNVIRWEFDYNIAECAGASMRGKIHSKKTKRKIGLAQKRNTNFLGHTHTEETKLKISKANKGKFVGEKSHTAKRTNEEIIKIRMLHATEKHTQKELSIIFNICQPSMSKIINRKTWKHI